MDRTLAKRLAVDEAYKTLDEYHLNRRRVVFIANDEQRQGGYGIVRQAHLHASPYLPTWIASSLYDQPQVVAVKEIKLSAMHGPSNLKQAFTKEVLVWSRLKGHPGIAKFLGFCADFTRKEAWLISPWEPYGNVSEFINGRELEVPEKLSLAYDTIDALSFLHQLNPPVCHGDIKSANVLVNLECRAVLCDFGLARLYEDSGFARLETTAGFKGSIRWCSPELVEGQPRTANSDIYAWAWLVWEIMTGELPYGEAAADYVIMRKIFEGPLPHVSGESRLSDCLQVWDLLKRCWAVEPLQRPTSAMCKTTLEYLPHCPPTRKTADPQTRSAVLLENLGDLESWKGNHKAGFDDLERALHLYEQDGNDKGIASVLRKQAAVANRDSNHVKVMNAASAAFEKCRTLQDDIGGADALFWIGESFLMENKRVDALRNLQESLELFRAKGHSVGIGKCLRRLGELYRRDGLATKALPILEEAVAVASRRGDRLGEAKALNTLGLTHQVLDHVNQAIFNYERAHDIMKNIGWVGGSARCLFRLGDIKLDQGLLAEAEELFRESIRVVRNIDAKSTLAQALWLSGKCFLAQDRAEEAISILEESCSILESLARYFSVDLALAAGFLADSKSKIGHREEALAWYSRAIAEWRKGGDKQNMSAHLASQGIVLVDMSRFDEGALTFEASLIIDQELGDKHGVRWNRRQLSRIPKTIIKWEAGRQARLALAKAQSLQTTSLLCDVKKLQRRVPQLRTPNLKSPIKLVDGSGL